MGKFNKIFKSKKVVNFAGGETFALSSKYELISILLTSFLGDTYYEKGDKALERLVNIINKIDDKKFVAKAAIFARNKYNLRSVSHVAAGEIARLVKGETWTKDFFEKIVIRVDDMSEIISYYFSTIKNDKKRPIPNSVKKGFRNAFNKFDSYQLAKYRGERNKVKLIDIVNLVHPKETEKNSKALKELVEGKLISVNTWEVKLTKVGQTTNNIKEKEILKGNVWKELIETRKIGYFALLRNLRNIIQQCPEIVDKACELLVDEKLIRNSKILPFRYTTAITEIKKLGSSGKYEIRNVIKALNKAIDISLKNVPVFSGKTLIALDVSGSMRGRPLETGSLFAAVLGKHNDNSDILVFDTSSRFITINPNDTTLTIAESLRADGGGTDFHCIFNSLRKAYDRIIILSDMQGWVGYNNPTKTFKNYKKKFNCSPYIYSFDLLSYSTTQFPEEKVFCMFGFSEKIFDTIKMFEKDKNALINEIEKSVIL